MEELHVCFVFVFVFVCVFFREGGEKVIGLLKKKHGYWNLFIDFANKTKEKPCSLRNGKAKYWQVDGLMFLKRIMCLVLVTITVTYSNVLVYVYRIKRLCVYQIYQIKFKCFKIPNFVHCIVTISKITIIRRVSSLDYQYQLSFIHSTYR